MIVFFRPNVLNCSCAPHTHSTFVSASGAAQTFSFFTWLRGIFSGHEFPHPRTWSRRSLRSTFFASTGHHRKSFGFQSGGGRGEAEVDRVIGSKPGGVAGLGAERLVSGPNSGGCGANPGGGEGTVRASEVVDMSESESRHLSAWNSASESLSISQQGELGPSSPSPPPFSLGHSLTGIGS